MIEDWNQLVETTQIENAIITGKKRTYLERKVNSEDVESFENDGWEIKKQFKNYSANMIKNKNARNLLVDKLWMIFYKMGFQYINKEGQFKFHVQEDGNDIEKCIDIVAMDDETCIFIDCYASDVLNRTTIFESKINKIKSVYRYLLNEVRQQYGEKKCKYILATNNYILENEDLENINNAKLVYFKEDNIDYYAALVDHLGPAARYQLLGNLFSNTTIKGMEEKVPAIEGKMGNLTYYSFLIEPERLLKIGYVLHRNKANHNQMPTYQRLIKKDRLKAIRKYVEGGGFFPNSLIISIDSKGKKLRFDQAQQNFQGEHSRLGILHLPKEYQSAYIIDGQHRLYGYSDSKYAQTNTLPVIAFVDLDKEMQVKMFMDINENQKPVSKTLRNILSIDLNWDSDNLSKRREAIILNVCQNLGEDTNSPLYGRILTGEDTVTTNRCITIENLKAAIDRTNLVNKYNNKSNDLKEVGIFRESDSKALYETLYVFLKDCFVAISEKCEEEWEKGSNGFLTINNTISASIRIFADIANIAIKKNNMDLDNIDPEDLYYKCSSMIIEYADLLNDLPNEIKMEIRTLKGGTAWVKAWRRLQVELHNKDSEFTNQDLLTFIEENCVDYNTDAQNNIKVIKEQIIKEMKNSLIDKLDYEKMYFSDNIMIKLKQKITELEFKANKKGKDIKFEIWDVMEFEDIVNIINYQSNWSSFMKDIFNKNGHVNTRANVVATIKSIQKYEQRMNSGKQITKTDFLVIDSLYQLVKFGA